MNWRAQPRTAGSTAGSILQATLACRGLSTQEACAWSVQPKIPAVVLSREAPRCI
ncbi:hypothetical protein EXIGLDRAFT_723070, partial [Exidia glandulosa HHB12029]